jgi:23S rRNA pseudouridine1911/1915/1917 synthase
MRLNDGAAGLEAWTGPGPLVLEVPAALAGERLDRALALLLGISRARAAELVAGGGTSVDGSRLRSGSTRLRGGEQLEVRPLAASAAAAAGVLSGAGGGAGPGRCPGAAGATEPATARVVYCDSEIAVVDKPAGLVVHPGAGQRAGTLVEQLLALFPTMAAAGPDGERPGIVHRLDKGTSGLLVVALNASARAALVSQWAARSVVRRYLAVVHGLVEGDEGVIDGPLGPSPSRREKMAVVEGGRDARTRYTALARSEAVLPSTLLSCRLETGRTHQIRAHMAAIGHPVLGDDRYSGPRLSELARRAVPGLFRPWLHAAELGFAHPLTGEDLHFCSEPPPELSRALEALALSLPGPTQVSQPGSIG